MFILFYFKKNRTISNSFCKTLQKKIKQKSRQEKKPVGMPCIFLRFFWNLRGHLNSLHFLFSLESPRQALPPFLGSNRIDLSLFWTPPSQDLEHLLQSEKSDHWQSTGPSEKSIPYYTFKEDLNKSLKVIVYFSKVNLYNFLKSETYQSQKGISLSLKCQTEYISHLFRYLLRMSVYLSYSPDPAINSGIQIKVFN